MAINELKLELNAFQGPFDLLLHLIRENDVDINDIPMSAITEQYIRYIKSMQELELDIVGDYLVMAATLLEIKTQLLLPIEPDPDVDDDYEEGDPRERLVQQLLLYQQFQTVASQLEFKQEERKHLFTRPSEDLSAYQNFIPLNEGELEVQDLNQAMYRALEKALERTPQTREIYHDTVTVSDKILQIHDFFKVLPASDVITFERLIDYPSRPEIITTFMAMLELVRKDYIVFKQDNRYSPIYMKRV